MATTGTSQVILQRLREEQAQNQWRDRTWNGSAPTPKPPTPQPAQTPEPKQIRTVTATPATRRSGNAPAAPTSTPTPRPTRNTPPAQPVTPSPRNVATPMIAPAPPSNYGAQPVTPVPSGYRPQPTPTISSPGNYGMTLQDAGRQYQNTVAPTSPLAQPASPMARPTQPMSPMAQPTSPIATPMQRPQAQQSAWAMPPRPQQGMPTTQPVRPQMGPQPQPTQPQRPQGGQISIDPQTGMRRMGDGGIGTILERGGGFAQRPSNLAPAQTSSDVLLRYLQQNPGDTEFLKRLQGILANPQPEGMQVYDDGFEYNTIGGNQRLTDVLAQYLAQLNGQQVQQQRGTSSR